MSNRDWSWNQSEFIINEKINLVHAYDIIDNKDNEQDPLYEDYKSLALYYKKLIRQTEKLVKISDHQQSYLMLKKTNEELEQKVEERTRELKELNMRLREVDQIKTSFFSNIFHELRTPLTIIMTSVESVISGELGDVGGKALSYLKTIHSNTIRLLKLINDLLELSRIEAGMVRMNYHRVDIYKVLKSYVSNFSSYTELKKIKLEMLPGGPLEEIYLDIDKSDKIFMNILSNAVKFTPADGFIRIEVMDAGDEIEVAFRDSGIGIPEDKLELVFEKFKQVDHKYKTEQEGTGIGLHLTKNLIEAQSGRITVESKLNSGSTFRVYFKKGKGHIRDIDTVTEKSADNNETAFSDNDSILKKEDLYFTQNDYYLQDVDNENNAGKTEDNLCSKKLLIIEDNSDLRGLIVSFLNKTYSVIQAKDGLDGLELAKSVHPDMIITDVMMPRMSGLEVCQEISRDPALNHIPVIILTARAGLDMKIEGLKLGALDYIYKPFRKSELLFKIESIFRIQDFKKALMEKDKMSMLGNIFAGLAHEMKNPLFGIKGSVEVLKKNIEKAGEPEKPVVTKAFQFIDENFYRIEKLLNSIKTICYKDSIDKHNVNLKNVVDSVLELTRNQWKYKAEMVVNIPPNLEILASYDALTHVLSV